MLDPNFVSFMITTGIILIGFAFAFLCLMRNADPMMNDLQVVRAYSCNPCG